MNYVSELSCLVVIGRMVRKSKLDSYASEIIKWRVEGRNYREIADLLRGRGLRVAFVTVARWYRRQMSLDTQQQTRVALQIQAAKVVMESEWATQMSEFYGNYRQALTDGNTPAAVAWARLWHEAWKAMLQKVVPNPRPVSLAMESEDRMSIEEFKTLILG